MYFLYTHRKGWHLESFILNHVSLNLKQTKKTNDSPSSTETSKAAAASCNANMACELNRSSALKSWAISLTRRAKGVLRKRRSVDFWYFLRKHYYYYYCY